MEIIYQKEFEELKERIRIILITAVDYEKEILMNEMTPLEGKKDILLFKRNGYEYFIGKFGKYNVVHVKSDLGNLGSNSSLLTTYNAFSLWPNTKMIVMIGMACGIKNSRCEIGDILVSERIFYYEKCKVIDEKNEDNNGELSFCNALGDYLITPSRTIFQIFENKDKWSYEIPYKEKNRKRQVQVFSGTINSGEKLVVSPKFQELVSKLNPGVGLGFDMESAGIAYACKNLKFDNWIIIKGVSDFGNGITDRNRKKAIKSAVQFCKYKFEKEDIFNNILDEEEIKYDFKISENIKEKLLINIKIEPNYITRKVIPKSKLTYLVEEYQKTTLYEAITESHNRIVLLSDAGAGKTEEAKNLVKNTIEKNNNMVAFYKSLNTYTDKKIEELIPKELEQVNLKNIVFVLDRF